MATLTGKTIAGSYKDLLKINANAYQSGVDGTLRAIEDGDATASALWLATDSALISGDGNRLYFYDADGDEHISADASGVLSIAAGAEIDLTATAVDLNGTLDLASTLTIAGITKMGASAGSGADAFLYTAGTAAHVGLQWDADGNTEGTLIGGADDHGVDFKFFGETAGAYVQWDQSADDLILAGAAGLDIAGDIDVDGTANLDIVDIDGAVNMAADLTSTANIIIDADDKALVLGADQDASIFSDAAGTIYFTRGQDVTPATDDTEGWFKFLSGSGGGTQMWIYGAEAEGCELNFFPDQGDDNADKHRIILNTTGDFMIDSYATGAWVTHLKLDTNSRISLSNNDSGTSNTIFGKLAGNAIAGGGTYNVAIGENALLVEDTGDYNVAIGFDSLKDLNYDGNGGNIALGNFAGANLTTGINNTLVGHNPLGTATTALKNTALGYQAMADVKSGVAVDGCVAIGYGALLGNASSTTGIDGTVAIGKLSLTALTTGTGNIAIGYQSLYAQTDGARNVSIGYQSLVAADSDEDSNTAVGYQALSSLNSPGADENTCIGNIAGDSLVSGSDNVIIGSEADGSATNAINQIVIGKAAMGQANNSVTLGNGNVTDVYMNQNGGAVVHAAGASFSKDSANTDLYIDSYHDTEATTPKIMMRKADGSLASPGAVDDNAIQGTISFQGYDGDEFIEGARIEALTNGNAADDDVGTNLNFYANAGAASVTLRAMIHTGGDFYTNDGSVSSLSDVRVKKDIADLTDGLSIVNQLKPRTYKYNGKGEMGSDDGITRYGFIADEVLDVASNYVNVQSGTIDEEKVDDLKSLSMMRMIPMLVKSIQELSAKVAALEAK